jgi:3-deoxy-D-manno-octulosonic-acid transferase
MRNFILSAAAIAIAGVSTVKANEIKNPIDSAVYTAAIDSTAHTVRQDSAATMVRQDSASYTVKKDSAAYSVKQDDSTKVPVKVEELPEPVKATLKADAYKEWTATGAFLITKADKSTYYQVDVKKDDKVAFLKVGADGVVQQ